MSSTQSKTINITLDNKGTYLSGSGTIDMSYTTNLGMTAGSSKTGYVTVTPQGMSELFQNNVAQPLRLTVSYYHYALTSNADNYSCLTIDANQVIKTASSDYSAVTYDNSGAIATSLTKNSSIQWTLHTKRKSVFESNPWTALGGYEGIQITTYFTRYDFSATAGSNVSSASVSSSTGYDGDQITYSCVLASGAVFDGWYNGSTRVSTSQSYTHTVNGADVALTAVATMPITTKTLSARYNGAQISGFPKSVQSAVSLSYGGTSKGSIPLSGGTKTFSCGGKIASGTININGTNLNNSGKLMATDVVVTVS